VTGISLSCEGCYAVVKDSILAQLEFTDDPGGINQRSDSGFASLGKVDAAEMQGRVVPVGSVKSSVESAPRSSA